MTTFTSNDTVLLSATVLGDTMHPALQNNALATVMRQTYDGTQLWVKPHVNSPIYSVPAAAASASVAKGSLPFFTIPATRGKQNERD